MQRREWCTTQCTTRCTTRRVQQWYSWPVWVGRRQTVCRQRCRKVDVRDAYKPSPSWLSTRRTVDSVEDEETSSETRRRESDHAPLWPGLPPATQDSDRSGLFKWSQSRHLENDYTAVKLTGTCERNTCRRSPQNITHCSFKESRTGTLTWLAPSNDILSVISCPIEELHIVILAQDASTLWQCDDDGMDQGPDTRVLWKPSTFLSPHLSSKSLLLCHHKPGKFTVFTIRFIISTPQCCDYFTVCGSAILHCFIKNNTSETRHRHDTMTLTINLLSTT